MLHPEFVLHSINLSISIYVVGGWLELRETQFLEGFRWVSHLLNPTYNLHVFSKFLGILSVNSLLDSFPE